MEPVLSPPAIASSPAPPIHLRGDPPPLSGGPLRCGVRAANGLRNRKYARLVARLAYWKLRLGRRLQLDGLAFICPGVKLEIGKGAMLSLGRWSWLGHGCKIRVHEGECSIGAKTVLGQECTISAFQHVSIGRECILADRVMLIDFDHGVVEAERPIRAQGIYKRDVRVGHNVWVGYGACFLRGATVGDNSVVGTNAVITKDVPAERGHRGRAGEGAADARGAAVAALGLAARRFTARAASPGRRRAPGSAARGRACRARPARRRARRGGRRRARAGRGRRCRG